MSIAVLVQAWDILAHAVARLLRRTPDASRIVVATIISHQEGEVSRLKLIANVPAITAHQALLIAAAVIAQRPRDEFEKLRDDLIPTLTAGSMTIVLETCENEAFAPFPETDEAPLEGS